MEDFISYGFYAKRTEDLTEEVGSCPNVLTVMPGHIVSLPKSNVCTVSREGGILAYSVVSFRSQTEHAGHK